MEAISKTIKESKEIISNLDGFMQFVFTCDEGHRHEQSILLASILGCIISPAKAQTQPEQYYVGINVTGTNAQIMVGNNLPYMKANDLKNEIEKRRGESHKAQMVELFESVQSKEGEDN